MLWPKASTAKSWPSNDESEATETPTTSKPPSTSTAVDSISTHNNPRWTYFGPNCEKCQEVLQGHLISIDRPSFGEGENFMPGSHFDYYNVGFNGNPLLSFLHLDGAHNWGEVTCKCSGQIYTIDFWGQVYKDNYFGAQNHHCATPYWAYGPDGLGWEANYGCERRPTLR